MSFKAFSAPVLEFRGLVKRFGGNCAVNDVSFELCPGEILALLGQNGAGKSTLIKLLAGIHAPSSGQILLNNEPLHKRHQDNEIAFIHQDLGLIEWMTVAENLALGLRFQRRFGLINWRATGRMAREILERVGGGIDPETRIFRLSRTERSLVAIARALASNAKLLVLDEPTSSLTAADVDRLFEVLSALKEKGRGNDLRLSPPGRSLPYRGPHRRHARRPRRGRLFDFGNLAGPPGRSHRRPASRLEISQKPRRRPPPTPPSTCATCESAPCPRSVSAPGKANCWPLPG